MRRTPPTLTGLLATGTLATGLLAAGAVAAGCGPAPGPAGPAAAEPAKELRFVDPSAPFILDWPPSEVASLTAALRGPNIGAVIVAHQPPRVRVLPDCWVSAVYTGGTIGMFTGALQIRGIDPPPAAAVRLDALQQVTASTDARQTMLLEYRFVIVGRVDTGATRPSASVLDIVERRAGACDGATHFVRAAALGAFERVIDPAAALAATMEPPGPKKAPAYLDRGGDIAKCVAIGSATDPACAALLKIELAPLTAARVGLRLTAFSVPDRQGAKVHLRFRGSGGVLSETPPLAQTSGFTDWPLPGADVSGEAPIVVELIEESRPGGVVIASGEITPASIRRGAANRGAFNVDLAAAPGGKPVATAQLVNVLGGAP